MPLTKRPEGKFKALAVGRLIRKTFHSLIYSSAFGPSLYFSKSAFEGEEPQHITIMLDWQTPDKEATDAQTK